METTHWADWADTFKLQDAACLITGVSPAKEMVAWADKLPPEARPAFKRLWDSYMRGTGVYKQPELDSADFQKMLHGIDANDFRAPTIVPARGMIRRQNMLIAPSEELMRKRLESVRVSREELHRWVKEMGIKSAYSFAPVAAIDATPAQTETTPTSRTSATGCADCVTAKAALPLEQVPSVDLDSVRKLPPTPLAETSSDNPAPQITGDGLPTKDIATLFDGVNDWPKARWPKNLSGSKWLHPARVALGGAGVANSMWNPLTLAQLIHDQAKGDRTRELLIRTLKNRFNNNAVLIPWRDAFNEYFDTFTVSD